MLAMMGSAPPLGSPPLRGGAGSPLLDPGGEPGNSAPPPVAGLTTWSHVCLPCDMYLTTGNMYHPLVTCTLYIYKYFDSSFHPWFGKTKFWQNRVSSSWIILFDWNERFKVGEKSEQFRAQTFPSRDLFFRAEDYFPSTTFFQANYFF